MLDDQRDQACRIRSGGQFHRYDAIAVVMIRRIQPGRIGNIIHRDGLGIGLV
ncbi:hypothetical protein SDC9_171862 [bioreactor metagenome]|uniref:Uncharacterized protein n=1 Tax=bioreactor metagenome TaxID=1076179 RepID=A0A645GL64_9ZZZZ